MEITIKNMVVLQESKESDVVNKVTSQGDGTTDGTRSVDGRSMQYKSSCFRCEGSHSAQTCSFKELNCFYCKRTVFGHLKGRDSCRFSGTCPEHQKQHHDEVQRYQLARLYDQNN